MSVGQRGHRIGSVREPRVSKTGSVNPPPRRRRRHHHRDHYHSHFGDSYRLAEFVKLRDGLKKINKKHQQFVIHTFINTKRGSPR